MLKNKKQVQLKLDDIFGMDNVIIFKLDFVQTYQRTLPFTLLGLFLNKSIFCVLISFKKTPIKCVDGTEKNTCRQLKCGKIYIFVFFY